MLDFALWEIVYYYSWLLALRIVLYLKSSENKLFQLDFSISKKHASMVKPSQQYDFLAMLCNVMQYFFEILAPLHISKHF